jgi:hypothetical protein
MVAMTRCAAMLGALALLCAQPAAAFYGNYGGFYGPGTFCACPRARASQRGDAGRRDVPPRVRLASRLCQN